MNVFTYSTTLPTTVDHSVSDGMRALTVALLMVATYLVLATDRLFMDWVCIATAMLTCGQLVIITPPTRELEITMHSAKEDDVDAFGDPAKEISSGWVFRMGVWAATLAVINVMAVLMTIYSHISHI